ncbi:MAG: malto-oligosyltrehalose synthase [Terriglobales bacterium]|jgi:(1->4)-alpha-D-glucan 1-alpha-D-glucosylmutase
MTVTQSNPADAFFSGADFQCPRATYRLQFDRNFTFRDAAALIPYLSALGISHCYVSPYLRARPGSTHGYDIIDHNALNPEIGTPEDYDAFVAELHRHGMGQILDVVPNHMGVMGSDNSWWLDVLENGEASDYADFFDIDWDPIKDELKGKVLIPILAHQYGEELERGELKLVCDCERGEFSIFYYGHRFPVAPAEYPRILGFQLERLQNALGATHDDFLELQSIATAFGHLPARAILSPGERAERNREKEVQKRRLSALCNRSPEMRDFLAANIAAFNGTPGDLHSFDALHDLIKAQAYRLAQWRVAADDINYRRFFDINDLAALRMENDAVFTSTHRFIVDLVAQRKVDGLRIDHPDGLYDPAQYLRRLREALTAALGAKHKHVYTIAEKILTGKESLRKDWPIDGTTGYEFTCLVNGLFVDSTAADKMERIYRSFCNPSQRYNDLVYTCKKLILRVGLASELNVLANLLSRIALADRHTCDFTLNSLRTALSEVIACFPVYRTYATAREVSSEDRRYIEQAVAMGRKRSNAADLSVFDFIRRALLVDVDPLGPDAYKLAVLRFAMKFQQVTAAVVAKGIEDTAFYRYNRLISLNEVGANPNKFGTTVEEFHLANRDRQAAWPASMLSSSTHDSKRSEDVRARINALSEIPSEWRLRLRHWRNWNRGKKRIIDAEPAPTRNDEYLLYQTLVGTWPTEALDDAAWGGFCERIEQYMLKAAREAKERTSWANTNTDYEAALSQFTRAILKRTPKNQFLPDFAKFAYRISRIGIFNSLSQSFLKMTSPGVPDIYQGNELFDFSLVDPDNRRPVDYDRRRKLLEELQRQSDSPENRLPLHRQATEYARSPQTSPERIGELRTNQTADSAAYSGHDALKLFLTWKTLNFRKSEPLLFQQGSYIPLKVTGSKSEHIVAYAREYQGRTAVVAVPRLCATLLGDTLVDGASALPSASLANRQVGPQSSEEIRSEEIRLEEVRSEQLWSDARETWGDTRLEIPDAQAPCYHNIFTGECVPPIADREQRFLPAAKLFSSFPVALLFTSKAVAADITTVNLDCADDRRP